MQYAFLVCVDGAQYNNHNIEAQHNNCNALSAMVNELAQQPTRYIIDCVCWHLV
jgi:hypothetical protein